MRAVWASIAIAAVAACGGKASSPKPEVGPSATSKVAPRPSVDANLTEKSRLVGTFDELSPRGPLPLRYQDIHWRSWPAGTLVTLRLASSHDAHISVYNEQEPGNDDQPYAASTPAKSGVVQFFVAVSGRHRVWLWSEKRGAPYELEVTITRPAPRNRGYLSAVAKTLDDSVGQLSSDYEIVRHRAWLRVTAVARQRCAWAARTPDCVEDLTRRLGAYAYGQSDQTAAALVSSWRDWFSAGLPLGLPL